MYISKLSGAGCKSVFEENAIEAIINASNGILRILNKLCNASLLIGNTREESIIDSDIVMMANEECELD